MRVFSERRRTADRSWQAAGDPASQARGIGEERARPRDRHDPRLGRRRRKAWKLRRRDQLGDVAEAVHARTLD